jgi:NTP pyrophosphatase (non-canonical NTP hydrolase)
MTLNEIAQKAVMYANKRASIEGLESPYDVLGMCRHTSSELFEVIDAYERWLDSKALDFLRNTSGVENYQEAFSDEIADVIMCALIIAAGQGVDVEKALEKCLEKNRKRAETGVKE